VGSGIVYLSDEVTISDREMRVESRTPNNKGTQRLEIQVQTGVRHIDFLQAANRRARGLYRVEGARLLICYSVGQDPVRPTGFDNNNDIVLVLERVGR
jgi:uncharacterized protein (TIGR03067 family)